MRSALGVSGLVMVCVGGRLFFRCFQNLMALFWMLEGEGIGLILPCIHCLVFSWTLSILLQKSKCRVSIGCFSQFKKSNFIEGPHTSLPYKTIGSITALKSLSQIWIGMSILIDLFMA